MKSDGGFAKCQNVKASQILLSGPAGGLIAYSQMIKIFQNISHININNLIGLDMGGTSTDVSRVENSKLNIQQTSQLQGLFVCAPHLQIDTIAAGGGSKLTFQNGMFKVGPQSVGSNPGPACYGIGNQLALTDANFLLNRLDSSFFPQVFGKNGNQGLNFNSTVNAFKQISNKINQKNQINSSSTQKSIQQIAQGFIQIANQLMAKSARKHFTFGDPDALIVFGSAGGQHCCDLGQKLSVKNIFIHRYSGVLSAYGLSKASQTVQKKYFLGKKVNQQNFNFNQLLQQIDQIKRLNQVEKPFQFDQKQSFLIIGYTGTSYQISIPLQQSALQIFENQHKKANGFVLPIKQYRIQFLRQKYYKYPLKFEKNIENNQKEDINKFVKKNQKVFMQSQWKQIPFYQITNLTQSQAYGPAMLVSDTVTVYLKQGWRANISKQLIYIKKQQKKSKQTPHFILCKELKKDETSPSQQQADPIILTLYSTRLMSIAQQMGKVLQRISISTNIKQRLDFSCGIFDFNGKVLANAPHIPVHLGSMQTAVIQQIKLGIQPGQSILTNHPIAGGSHLPDLTVVSCCQIQKGFNIYVASRGHHADIGGISPGSMPPFSKYLTQEGLAVEKHSLMNQNGQFKQKQTRQLFKVSRRIDDNISDLLAQIAANQIGLKLLTKFINQQGLNRFRKYINFICQNAASCVQKLLVDFSLKNNFKDVDSIFNQEYMDDGTKLCLKLTIDRIHKKAIFDFTGTQSQILGNTNAPFSITRSAIIYCLRSLIGKSIPLNSGCLQPIQIILPPNTILSPSKQSAVVGGNVQTSQRIVDLILKPFNYVSASQGTMNNFLFGNNNISYYQTIGGGTGAGNGWNGNTGQVHMTNTRITDVENLERKYPVILKQFKIRQNSGGQGKYNGGNGLIRQFIFLQQLDVSILSQRRVFNPYGLQGGKPGERGKNYLIKYSDKNHIIRSLGSKNLVQVQKYDTIRILTPGGGGYGKIQQKNI